jgi:hypothetical protein
VTARLAAVAGLSATVAVAVVGIAVAAPAPADRVRDCVDQAVAEATARAVTLPAAERDAYLRSAVEAARTRCAALATSTTSPTTTTTSPTTTTTTTTTTSPTTTTTTTSPTRTTTTTTTSTTSSTTTPAPRPARYEVVATGVIGTGPQTLEASCDPGDQVVSYRYQVGNPTGPAASRRVGVSSTGRTVRLNYEVVGTVADPKTSLTVVCRHTA